jgi:putative nucleotidyltransferase with HDIG domain
MMTADDIIANVPDLPVVSETARKLTVQLMQPDSHRDDLIKTLRCDNVLTAKLLRVCNSAECAPEEPVVSLDQAVMLLGDEMIFRLVCAIGYGTSLRLAAPGYDTEANGLWVHSLATAVGAEHLCTVKSYGDYAPSTAFTAGLLHDIGKIVLSRVMTPKHRVEIRSKMTTESLTRFAAEKAVFGADHSEVGACLLKKWGLPEPILEAVAHHHSPVTKPDIQLSAVVHLANCAAHLAGSISNSEAHVVQAKNATAQALGIDVEKVEETIHGISEAMEHFAQLQTAA